MKVMFSKKVNLIVFGFIFISYCIIFFFIKDFRIIQDEYYHFNQIERFVIGESSINPALTTLPGYHLVMATLVRIFQINNLAFLRLLNVIFGLLTVSIFYKVTKIIDPKHAIYKTLQFTFLPLVMIFVFLVYTDIFSLGLLLAAYYFVEKKQYTLAGVIGLFSLAVRQNNVIWLLFYCAVVYVQVYGLSFHWKKLVSLVRKVWFILLDILLFILFSLWHGGFSLGDEGMHPVSIFHPGNIYLLLFLFALLFWPYLAGNLYAGLKVFRSKKLLLLLIPFFVTIPTFTFINDHPFNSTWWFLHNFFLVYFTADVFRKVLFFTIVTISLYALGVIRLEKKSFYLLYPFTVLFLAPSWLIEARYYIVPFCFFILFKKEDAMLTSRIQILYEIVLSVILITGILNWWFFI